MSSEYNVLRAANGENPWNDAVSIEAIEEESTTEIPDSGDGTGIFDPRYWTDEALARYRERMRTEQQQELERRSKAVAYDWAVEALDSFIRRQNDKGAYVHAADLLGALRGVQERVQSNLTRAITYTGGRFNEKERTDG